MEIYRKAVELSAVFVSMHEIIIFTWVSSIAWLRSSWTLSAIIFLFSVLQKLGEI